jgi:hypothetical protein
MTTKSISLCLLGLIGIASGVLTQYPNPYNPSQAVSFCLTVFFAMATFAWFRADATQRSYQRSPVLNVVVFGLSVVGLPYYFFRSRGFKRGALATLGAIGIFFAVCLISGLSAMATAWAQPA